MDQRFVHCYTGDGKGKTTAAIGLAIRAAGAGFRVFIGQFIKGMYYSELSILERLQDLITVRQYGRACFIDREPDDEDRRCAREGFDDIVQRILSRDFELVILDEITIALTFGLIPLDDVLNLIRNRPDSVELVLTGRGAPQELIDASDLVTEMHEIKHYYQRGILARRGIDK